MPVIQAFHGIRYDLGHVGSLSDVVAPPYDVIDATLQKQLYEKHPANVVRLILNRAEPGDASDQDRYERAARFLRHWRREGLLQADSQASIYAYQQLFEWDGQSYARLGFMARVRLEPLGTGSIFPHEETHAAAKSDRLRLTKACKANLSQVFSVFPDAENRVRQTLETAMAGRIPFEATDHLGVVHRMWALSDVQVIGQLASLVANLPLFIADGHHRYETACNYRDELAEEKPLPADHPAHFVLMMCVGMSDPGMIILPTHRLFRGLPDLSQGDLTARLAGAFLCQPAGQGAARARQLWDQIETDDDQGQMALYSARDDQWLLVRITDEGRAHMAQIAAEHSPDWQALGVSILHRLVVDRLLGFQDLPKPMYVHSVDEVVQAIETGDTSGRDATGQMGQGGNFPLAALVMPATLQHVRAISEQGERMPAKSTYFYPKLLSGLVFNPLE